MAGPPVPGTDQFQTNPHYQKNPLRLSSISKPGLKKKKSRVRLTNFAPPSTEQVDLTSSPDLEVVKPVQVPPRAQGDEATKLRQLKPAQVKPAATTPAVPADFSTKPRHTATTTTAATQPIDVIDLTIDSPVLAPMKPAAPYPASNVNPLPSITVRPPSRASATIHSQQTWSRTPAGHIQLPEPRQSLSAGYHRQHQGPRYKVLPAGFGGLELARSHFGSERERGHREHEDKVRRDMEYTLKRHVEEYWR